MPSTLIQELLELNTRQADLYHEQAAQRQSYRDAHPTLIVVFKCMDGRVHLPVMTKIPFGVFRPKRNIGGKFRMGWPTERARVSQLMEYAWSNRRRCLFMVTYHFSKSDQHLGCAGHGYDTEKAKASARNLVGELMLAYNGGIQENFAIMVGVETDEETLIFHGDDSQTVSMGKVEDTSDAYLLDTIGRLYPTMRPDIARDLVPLMRGNVEHVHKVRSSPKKHVDLEHRERVVAVGQGFDWLHKINYALIINDGDPDLRRSISVALGIVEKNRDAKRISKSGGLYFVSVPYFRQHEKEAAILHAKYLTEVGLEVLKTDHPDVAGFFHPLTCVMHWDTRRLEVIE